MAVVLRVNLSTGGIRREAVAPDVVERYAGGRGVGTKLLLDSADPAVDAIDANRALEIGERIWNLERVYNLRAGFTKRDDALPPRMLSEPLGEGMSAGHVVPLAPMLAEYYQLRGWDPDGRPTPEKLAALRVG